MNNLKGKIIKSITKRRVITTDDCEAINIRFTDGTSLKITSWDYEGYRSGFEIEIKKK